MPQIYSDDFSNLLLYVGVGLVFAILVLVGSLFASRRRRRASNQLRDSDELPQVLDPIYREINRVNQRQALLENRLNHLERMSTIQSTPPSREANAPQTLNAVAPRELHDDEAFGKVREVIQLYNAAIDNPSIRLDFRQRFQPIRIGTTNAMARRRDPNIEPDFQTANDGDYYAIPFDESGRRPFIVVPRFDLIFQDSNFGPGAMGLVFDCPHYDRRLNYSHVKVLRPATFESNSGQYWTVKGTGTLDLGKGE